MALAGLPGSLAAWRQLFRARVPQQREPSCARPPRVRTLTAPLLRAADWATVAGAPAGGAAKWRSCYWPGRCCAGCRPASGHAERPGSLMRAIGEPWGPQTPGVRSAAHSRGASGDTQPPARLARPAPAGVLTSPQRADEHWLWLPAWRMAGALAVRCGEVRAGGRRAGPLRESSGYVVPPARPVPTRVASGRQRGVCRRARTRTLARVHGVTPLGHRQRQVTPLAQRRCASSCETRAPAAACMPAPERRANAAAAAAAKCGVHQALRRGARRSPQSRAVTMLQAASRADHQPANPS